jgi:hypothetical protein
MPAKIYERFGDGMNDPISDLDAMFAELESLGYAKSVTKEEDCFSFEPSGSWLS